MNLSRSMTAVLLVMSVGLLFSIPSMAQVSGGSLSGTITDASGGAIPRAQIVIENVATGVTRTITTNDKGFYDAPNLLAGDYRVTVSATGFSTQEKTGITLNVGAERTLELTMQIGTVLSKLLVSSEAPLVDLVRSDIGATVNGITVRELPLNGRSWTDLAALQPGVDTIHTQPAFSNGSQRGTRGFGQEMTISGARPQQNNYRLDGISINDYSNGGPGSVLGGNIGVDAIQEFSVLTTNYAAEYGKTSGGVVNAITRSGTNEFHGSVYEFLRNSSLDAANYFEHGKRSPFKRNQFGAALGGPLIKNHTFFFANYEGIRQAKGIANTSFVPSLDARNGIIDGTPIPGGVDPAAQKYLALYPLPNGGPLNGDPNISIWSFSGQQIVNENFVTTRIDHKFSEKDSLFGTYVYDRTPYLSPDTFNNVELASLTARQIVAIEETHAITPTFINAVRFGFNHEHVDNNQGAKAINPAAADSTLGAFPGTDASTVMIFGGLTTLPGGLNALLSFSSGWNSYQAYDDAFVVRGTHAIKFGAAYERMKLDTNSVIAANGEWIFPSLPAFLTNHPLIFVGGLPNTETPRNLRQSVFGAYVQDDWRVRPSLTVNLGLRYEMSTLPTEVHGKLSNLRNLSDATPHLGEPFFNNPTTKNFEPRIGFAWDPFHNGKMAVRGGAGLFDVLPLPYQYYVLTATAAPFFQLAFLRPAPPFSSVNVANITGNDLAATYLQTDSKRNYVAQYNLNVQYQLSSNFSAMVAYVGSRGVHQPVRVDEADLVLPNKTSAGYVWPQVDASGNLTSGPNAGNPPNRINGNFGQIRGMFYDGRSYYDALELQLAKHMSHGLQAQAAYTWSKSIDTGSAAVAGDAFSNSISSLNYFDTHLTRGLSDFNVGRTLVVNATWNLPAPKSFSGPARWIADGWEVGAIFTVSSGVPFTPTWGTGSDPANTLSSDPYAYPNRLGGPGCQTLTNPGNPNNYFKTQCFGIPTAPNPTFWSAHCDPAPPSLGGPVDPASLQCYNLLGNAGRNTVIGPGLTNLDFSVFKNSKITENFKVQFRMEIFNILNHANFAPPGPFDGNTDVFDGTGQPNPAAGHLVRTSTPERQIQFGLKFIF